MPAATISRLLERLHADAANQQISAQKVTQVLAEFRSEREASDGALSEEQWRGVLLSAIDLLEAQGDAQAPLRAALAQVVRREYDATAA